MLFEFCQNSIVIGILWSETHINSCSFIFFFYWIVSKMVEIKNFDIKDRDRESVVFSLCSEVKYLKLSTFSLYYWSKMYICKSWWCKIHLGCALWCWKCWSETVPGCLGDPRVLWGPLVKVFYIIPLSVNFDFCLFINVAFHFYTFSLFYDLFF